MKTVLETYSLEADGVQGMVRIYQDATENVPIYALSLPEVDVGTAAMLRELSENLAHEVPVSVEEITDPRKIRQLKHTFYGVASQMIQDKFPTLAQEQTLALAGMLLHTMYGLGEIEMLLADDLLEEIAINNSEFPITVFHKKYGWMKTTRDMKNEEQIYTFASQIGRKVGREITALTPIMDAHLLTGDRVAATLFPVSTAGNTITIRKFARSPWTVISLIKNKTTSIEIVAYLWLALQYEMNVLVSGGTASGKSSFLNSLSILIPPNQRVISIEDTREIELSKPQRWNWVPLSSRAKNPEGQGEVTMLDLMVASLRMRPDRIIVGEVRRREQAETMFEAMHTGHSVYTTMHADTVEQITRRLLEPPIAIPKTELEALQILVVQFRDRRKNVRRTLEVAEILHGGDTLQTNFVFRWRPRTDTFERANESIRLFEDLNMHVGMTREDILQDLDDKSRILQWLVDQDISDIEQVGKLMELYYRNPTMVVAAAREKRGYAVLFA